MDSSDLSEDDWFNKSLGDFEIPTKTKPEDWQNEDDTEEEELQRPVGQQNTTSSTGRFQTKPIRAKSRRMLDSKGKGSKLSRMKEKDLKRGASGNPSLVKGQKSNKSNRTKEKDIEGAACGDPPLTKNQRSVIWRTVGPTLVAPRAGPVQEKPRLTKKGGKKTPEGTDENWFQRNLKELPTLFNLVRIHSVSTTRLKSMLHWLQEAVKDHQELDDASDMMQEDNTQLQYNFLHNKTGNFTKVLQTTVKGNDSSEDDLTEENSCLKTRRDYYSSFLVVVKWLLDLRDEAEIEAREALARFPLSFIVRANLFYILWKKGAHSEAIDTLQYLIKLKSTNPDLYRNIFYEEQGELGHCYTELGPDFIPEALVALETVALQKSKQNAYKCSWALNLRRSTTAHRNWTLPEMDTTTPLLKAVDLLLEVIQNAEKGQLPAMKASAAAELGEILHSCELSGELIDQKVLRICREAGLNAAKCFEMVMEVEDLTAFHLVRAGKFFRISERLKESEKALKRAVALQDSPKAHHQLALTLKKMAVKERNKARKNRRGPPSHDFEPQRNVISHSRRSAINRRMAMLERTMKAHVYLSLSRSDRYVKQALEHFNKALLLSHGENSEVSFDLGLMLKGLGEYPEALDHFLMLVDSATDPMNTVRAFEQAGLIFLEKCSLEKCEAVSGDLKALGRLLISVAILVQMHLVCHLQHFVAEETRRRIWQSFHTLGQYLQLQHNTEEVPKAVSATELWLLRLLKVYADTLPVLISLQQDPFRDATDAQELIGRLQKYIRDKRYDDAILFCRLFHLTGQWHLLKAELVVKVHVEAARTRLLIDADEGNISKTFNVSIAKRLFCWNFEDLCLKKADAVSSMPLNSHLENHLLLVYALCDPEAAQVARDLQPLLQNTFGLKTHLTEIAILSSVVRKANSPAISRACKLLFVVGRRGSTSQELQHYAQEAIQSSSSCPVLSSSTLCCNILTLTLDENVVLPSGLQDYSSFQWKPALAATCHESDRTRDSVNTVCRFFCFLVGVDPQVLT